MISLQAISLIFDLRLVRTLLHVHGTTAFATMETDAAERIITAMIERIEHVSNILPPPVTE